MVLFNALKVFMLDEYVAHARAADVFDIRIDNERVHDSEAEFVPDKECDCFRLPGRQVDSRLRLIA